MKQFIVCFILILNAGLTSAESNRELLSRRIAAFDMERHYSTSHATTTLPATTSEFFKNHMMVFFFSSSCPHCHIQAPILKNWANQHGALVDARSFDDKALPEFQSPLPATKELVEAAFQGNTIRYPALFVMNRTTHTLYPVAIGALTAVELETRMQILAKKITAYEQG